MTALKDRKEVQSFYENELLNGVKILGNTSIDLEDHVGAVLNDWCRTTDDIRFIEKETGVNYGTLCRLMGVPGYDDYVIGPFNRTLSKILLFFDVEATLNQVKPDVKKRKRLMAKLKAV